MPVIEIKKLKKYYGKHIGILDVAFSVNEGEIFGFVGPNGAGKSTTIKVLMSLIFAQEGAALIGGMDVVKDAKKIKAFTGYVPSEVRLYPNMRVKELLKRNADFYEGDCSAEAERLSLLFEIDPSKRFRELSTGNKKKASIICALMSNPMVIILDEPTSGLDPVMQKLLFDELRRRTTAGATVLLSSHNLSEVGEYCDRVAFIKGGSILAVTDLKQKGDTRKIVTLTGGTDVPADWEPLGTEGGRRKFRTSLTGGALLDALSGVDPADFTVQNESMEEYFWSLYGREVAR